MKGFKPHHRIRDFFDETVILFNQVIQLFNLEYFNKTDQTSQHQHILMFSKQIIVKQLPIFATFSSRFSVKSGIEYFKNSNIAKTSGKF